MKRIILLSFALALAAHAGPAQYRYETPSQVTEVTVYTDRALVKRVAHLDLRSGETTLVLKDLPANLWDNSLQVSGSGPAGTNVVDVQSRNVFLDAEPSPVIRDLEETLKKLHQIKIVLDDEIRALDNDRSVLSQINEAATTLPTEGNAPRPSFDDWRELLKFNADENRRIQKARREKAQEEQDLNAKISATERQLQEARGRQPGRRAVKEVTVRLAANEAGSGNVTVAYTVPGANWTPVYQARLDSNARRVVLDYQAQVVNRTGDTWDNVALTLSTAQPSAGGSAPEARPWIVEEQRITRDMDLRSRKAYAMMESAPAPTMMAMDAVAESAPMKDQQATVETGLTAATFTITTPTTIPADGTVTKVSVTTLDLTAGLRYATTPKLQEAAFLSAKVENNTEFPLLAGSLAAFVDGAFIANSHLETTMAGEEFELALGVDEAVAVERTLVNRFVENVGFTNKSTRTTYEIAIKLTNHKSIPAGVELAESLPVSRHEKIIVKLVEPDEDDIGGPDDNHAFTRDEEGVLTWTGSLAPGARRDMTLKFSIEHPNDLNVQGVE
jgi:uncharacterized protein (TIGR02231 family)